MSVSIDWGPLQTYLDNPEINEIMVINEGEVWVEDIDGLRHVASMNSKQTQQCVEQISRTSGRRVDLMSPILDARMSDGSRACVVIPPISVGGPTISIRKFTKRILPLAAFGPVVATDIVKQLITTHANIVISGATSSGKTSLLSSASQFFAPRERIVCVEDTSELRFAHPHVVALQTRQPNQEGSGEISMQSLVRTSLRLRPDRLMVGEVRGAEVIDMLLALSSGHRGCWSTVHSSSASGTISRLSALVLRDSPQWSSQQSIQIIHSAIDVIIHVERTSSHRRHICDIIQLQPQGSVEHLYKAA